MAAAFGAAVAFGCATSKTAQAPTTFGDARRISIIATSGDPYAANHLITELATQAHAAGRFEVLDRRAEGLAVRGVDGSPAMLPDGALAGPDEVLLRIDVVKWGSSVEESVNSSGGVPGLAGPSPGQVARISPAGQLPHPAAVGRVGFRLSAVGRNGSLMTERPYEARFGLEGKDDRLALEMAACYAISRLLSDVTPR